MVGYYHNTTILYILLIPNIFFFQLSIINIFEVCFKVFGVVEGRGKRFEG
jgi:hypothetical protein